MIPSLPPPPQGWCLTPTLVVWNCRFLKPQWTRKKAELVGVPHPVLIWLARWAQSGLAMGSSSILFYSKALWTKLPIGLKKLSHGWGRGCTKTWQSLVLSEWRWRGDKIKTYNIINWRLWTQDSTSNFEIDALGSFWSWMRDFRYKEVKLYFLGT